MRHAEFMRGERAEDDVAGAVVTRLGGCDTIVVQAAAHAHDLGHPPFGHLGERVLDRVAREKLGLAEGLRNAQSFRILTQARHLWGETSRGLNLTAAVRAATLKYPWTRTEWIGASLQEIPSPISRVESATMWSAALRKFSAYALDASEMEEALDAFPQIESGVQTVECAVMDLADDIAYAVHDLDDFTRAGVLQQAAVSGNFGPGFRSPRRSRKPSCGLRDAVARTGVLARDVVASIAGSKTAGSRTEMRLPRRCSA